MPAVAAGAAASVCLPMSAPKEFMICDILDHSSCSLKGERMAGAGSGAVLGAGAALLSLSPLSPPMVW